jgi:hypothetical protein
VRGHHEGSIFRRKRDGKWTAALSTPDGRRIERACRWNDNTRDRARELLREIQAAQLLGAPIPPAPTIPLPPSLTGARRATIPARLGSEYLAASSERGWIVRSLPEARIALVLDRLGLTPRDTAVQGKVGRIRIDFAAIDVKVGIEVDGPHHRLPEIAMRGLERDATLAAAGWMIFRVDAYGSDEELNHRLARIVRFIRGERLSR